MSGVFLLRFSERESYLTYYLLRSIFAMERQGLDLQLET